jgi:hypothetical protein
MVFVMDNIAESAHELQRAAGWFQKRASDPGAVAALPAALAHVEEALDRLATAMVKAAQAVEDVADDSGAEGGAVSAMFQRACVVPATRVPTHEDGRAPCSPTPRTTPQRRGVAVWPGCSPVTMASRQLVDDDLSARYTLCDASCPPASGLNLQAKEQTCIAID